MKWGLINDGLFIDQTQEPIISGFKKTSITVLRLHLEPVIYKSKLLDSKCFASLVLDAFLKPFEKYGVFLDELISQSSKV